MSTFRRELISLINRHSKENGSNTPDYILAEYLIECLHMFDRITNMRNGWYGEKLLKSKIKETRNEFEKEIDAKPHAITFEEAERMASDMNYHNMCARATLGNLPKVKPEDLMKDLNSQVDKSKVIEVEPLTIKEGTSKPRKRNPNTL